jgi:hypothetical protein
MNAKDRMHQSIENVTNDMLKMQDLVVRLSREIYELHVAKEHEPKQLLMKEQIGELQSRLDSTQDFLVACDNLTVHRENRLTEIDVAL